MLSSIYWEQARTQASLAGPFMEIVVTQQKQPTGHSKEGNAIGMGSMTLVVLIDASSFRVKHCNTLTYFLLFSLSQKASEKVKNTINQRPTRYL
jgi:hypothetical protein